MGEPEIKLYCGKSYRRSLAIEEKIKVDKARCLIKVEKEKNPYSASFEALPANSATFVGRDKLLRDILRKYAHPEQKPTCINIVGERRIGKSSLLNQVLYYLKELDNLVIIQVTTQSWQPQSANDFLIALYKRLIDFFEVDSFSNFREFIRFYAKQGFRFLIVMDEFEAFCKNSAVDSVFLGELRSLADDSIYKLGFLLVSRKSLHDLAMLHRTESSSFHNIFDSQIVSLLKDKEVEQLTQTVWQLSIDKTFLYANELKAWAGNHPLLLQLLLRQVWQDVCDEEETDWREIKRKCEQRYEDLWLDCNDKERDYLKNISLNKQVENYLVDVLFYRGFLNESHQLFCLKFNEFVLSRE